MMSFCMKLKKVVLCALRHNDASSTYVSLLLGCCPPKTNISFFLSGWGLPYQTRQTATKLNKNKNGSFIPVLWSRPVKKINLNLQFIL